MTPWSSTIVVVASIWRSSDSDELDAHDCSETNQVPDALVGVVTVYLDDPAVLARHPTLLRVVANSAQQGEKTSVEARARTLSGKDLPSPPVSRWIPRNREKRPRPNDRPLVHRTLRRTSTERSPEQRRQRMRKLVAAGAMALGLATAALDGRARGLELAGRHQGQRPGRTGHKVVFAGTVRPHGAAAGQKVVLQEKFKPGKPWVDQNKVTVTRPATTRHRHPDHQLHPCLPSRRSGDREARQGHQPHGQGQGLRVDRPGRPRLGQRPGHGVRHGQHQRQHLRSTPSSRAGRPAPAHRVQRRPQVHEAPGHLRHLRRLLDRRSGARSMCSRTAPRSTPTPSTSASADEDRRAGRARSSSLEATSTSTGGRRARRVRQPTAPRRHEARNAGTP